jgi:hypothetical protein
VITAAERRRNRRLRVLVCAGALLLGVTARAGAHPAPFSFLDLALDDQGLHGSIIVHDLDAAHDLGVDPPDGLLDPAIAAAHRAALEALVSARLRIGADGEPRAIEWTGMEVVLERFGLRLSFRAGARPAQVDLHAVMFPYDPVHQTFVNIQEDGALRHQAILTADAPTLQYFSGRPQGRLAVIRTFVASGIEHILIGPDHVLFLIGLLLLGGTLGRLALIVTAFTIGHSITLSLAALDIVSPPARYIEPLIALTIVVVGADNLLVLFERQNAARNAVRSLARDARPLFAGAFGLIHGFGFASVLKEFGLPREALAWSLVSFNVGVEIGQLAIVVVAAGLLALIVRARPSLAHPLTLFGSIGVILAGAYWFVERVFLTGGQG